MGVIKLVRPYHFICRHAAVDVRASCVCIRQFRKKMVNRLLKLSISFVAVSISGVMGTFQVAIPSSGGSDVA